MRTFIAAAATVLTWLIIVGGGIALWSMAPDAGMSADGQVFASLIIGFILGMIGTFAAYGTYAAIED